eukprot:XP_019922578.1 PREDICTED: uncharacterized protein LOC109618698 [Crassostrea gigas]
MPKRKPSQPQGDVHVEVEPRTNHGKRKKDRATMDVPQTSNLVPVEHAEVGKVSSIGTTSKEGSGDDPFRVSEANLAELNLTSVWIVGSSIIKHAAIEARVRPGGTSLGLKSMGIELWWQEYGGLKFVDVAKKLRYLATLQDSPQFIVMHGNDFGQIPLSKLLYRVKWDIRLMASVFPDCQLVWSFILPRITWRYSQRPRCMEQARNRKDRTQNASRSPDHALPHSSHVRGVKRVEDPGRSLFVEKVMKVFFFHIDDFNFQLLRSINKICSPV